MNQNRRSFIKSGTLITSGILAGGLISSCSSSASAVSAVEGGLHANGMFFQLSLAQWSFHKALFAKTLDHLDFAAKTASLGIDGVEYVNQFFKDKAQDIQFLNQMTQRAEDAQVRQLLIMVDGEGGLGDTDDIKRKEAVKNHFKWVDAARELGCHSIRVNAYGQGNASDVASAAVHGLGAVSEYAAKQNINVIVENHGGYSSDGTWISGVMKEVNMKNCGTLPDFGNFCVTRKKGSWECEVEYDRYKGVEEMMPFAKAVSAKSNDFDEAGNETNTDFMRMMKIVKDYGYRGFVGIEYEGSSMEEEQGIIATRDLLIKVGKKLS